MCVVEVMGCQMTRHTCYCEKRSCLWIIEFIVLDEVCLGVVLEGIRVSITQENERS